jgi:hypothetical protein
MIMDTRIPIAIVVSAILIAGTVLLTEFSKGGTAFACDTFTGGAGTGGGSEGSGSGFTGGLGEGCGGHGAGGIDPPLGPCGGGGQYDSGNGGRSAGPTCNIAP